MGRSFAEEVAVEHVGGGRYGATIDEAWNLRPLPQGGLVTALAVNAMAHHLDDETARLRTLHTTFVGQVAHGAVEIDVEVLRRGRSMSHVRAEVCSAGSQRGHVTTAVFGRPRRGFEFVDVAPPAVPPPEECPSFRDPPPPGVPRFEPMPFWEHRVEGRNAIGHPPWEDYTPTSSDRATWFRLDVPAHRPDGTLDPLALVVLCDVMPGAVGERVGPSDQPWFGPSVDLTVHLLDDCRSAWILAHNRARHAGDGYASAEMALWDMGARDEPRLVAYATQVLFFAFPDDPGRS